MKSEKKECFVTFLQGFGKNCDKCPALSDGKLLTKTVNACHMVISSPKIGIVHKDGML